MTSIDIKNRILEKQKLLQLTKLDPNVVKNLGEWLRMELTYTSNALEGNTLTRQETKLVAEEGLSIGGKSITEILEIKNHTQALNFVQKIATDKKTQELTELDLLKIHEIILNGIDDYNAGKYRNVPVRITGSMTVVPNYLKVSTLMHSLFNDVQNFTGSASEALDLAIQAHYQLVTIHPFVDGNGRSARLFFNLILLQNQLPLSFIQKEERKQYLVALEKAQTGGSDEDYLKLMYIAMERSLDIYLDQSDKTDSSNLQDNSLRLYKIGEIAKISNETISRVRYWTELGLLNVFNTTESGYALYQADSISKIKQIRYLQQEKRLTLEEIKKLLD